ncbi:unnamed protein product, partial [Meganyctiphanes norvegica]
MATKSQCLLVIYVLFFIMCNNEFLWVSAGKADTFGDRMGRAASSPEALAWLKYQMALIRGERHSTLGLAWGKIRYTTTPISSSYETTTLVPTQNTLTSYSSTSNNSTTLVHTSSSTEFHLHENKLPNISTHNVLNTTRINSDSFNNK